MTAGLLIKGAVVLDLDLPLAERDVRIEDDTIVEVGAGLASEGEEAIAADGMLVMPGLINAHTHSDQSLGRGSAPNLPLDLWLMWAIFGQSPLTADELYTTAAAGALEMLQTGCTSVLDHPWILPEEFEERIEAVAQAYLDVGIRVGLAPGVGDRDFFETLPRELTTEIEPPAPLWLSEFGPDDWIRTLRGFVDGWAGRDPRLVPVLGPSAPQRCSRELLAGIAELARERGLGVHMHLLEARSQVFACRERYGCSVVDELDELGLLGSHVSFAHCIWLDAEEQGALARSGSVIVHNPASNLRLGSGLIPLQRLLELEAPVALGADGAASSDSQNMFEVMKLASLVHTLYGHYTSWPSAEAIWGLCLRGGAAALRQPLGRIAPGAKADLALLRLDRHVAVEKEYLLRSLLFAELGQSVDTVVCGGEVVLREGRSTRIDEADLQARALTFMSRIAGETEQRRAALDAAETFLTAVEVEAARRLPAPSGLAAPSWMAAELSSREGHPA